MPFADAAPYIAMAAGAALSANAAGKAGGQASGAANAATAAQLQMFNTINAQGAPYRQAGYTALADLMARLGDQPTAAPVSSAAAPMATSPDGTPVNIVSWEDAASLQQNSTTPFVTRDPRTGQLVQFNGNPDAPSFSPFAGTQAAAPAPQAAPSDPNAPGLLHAFNATDLGTNLSPSFNFMLGTGLGSVNNKLNASGGNISGNTLRGMVQFGEDYASTGYQQAFENYNTNQSNIYNRLANIAGLGQVANTTTANAGTTISGNAANTMVGAGLAQAGGTVGTANALAGGLNNIGSWYALNNLVKPTGTVSDPGASGPG